jgi:hypothetical protein
MTYKDTVFLYAKLDCTRGVQNFGNYQEEQQWIWIITSNKEKKTCLKAPTSDLISG